MFLRNPNYHTPISHNIMTNTALTSQDMEQKYEGVLECLVPGHLQYILWTQWDEGCGYL